MKEIVKKQKTKNLKINELETEKNSKANQSCF